jgi:prophage DNA circulation protein
MEPRADNQTHLSVRRAFVVQFQADTAVERGHLAGRMEHVVSGQAATFQSLETLLAFIAQVLHTESESSAESRV